jgi:hypothetical protein
MFFLNFTYLPIKGVAMFIQQEVFYVVTEFVRHNICTISYVAIFNPDIQKCT